MYKPVDPDFANESTKIRRKKINRFIIFCIIFTILVIFYFVFKSSNDNNSFEDNNSNIDKNTDPYIDIEFKKENNFNKTKNNNFENSSKIENNNTNSENSSKIENNNSLSYEYIDFNPDRVYKRINPYDNPSLIKNYPLDKKTNTKCLDGSQYGIYYAPGRDSGKNKVVIGFEGMNWCYDRDINKIPRKCKERTSFYYGSSKTWKDEYIYDYNIYGGEKSKNAQFYNWHRFIIPYCDGTGNQGHISKSVKVDGTELFFRGYRNTIEGLKFVFQHVDLDSLEKVAVWGCSSGAWTAFQWMSVIENYLFKVNSKIVFLGIMNAGYFIDYKSVKTNDHEFLEKFKSMYKFANKEVPAVNKECLKDFKDDPVRCLFPENLINYIKSPIFMFQAQYDSWQIWEALEEKCVNDHRSLKFCNEKQKKDIIEFRDYTMKNIKKVILKNKNVSIMSPACVLHCYNDYQRTTSEVQVNGYNIDKALSKFIDDDGKKQLILIDDVDWPNNKGCANA